MLTLSPYSGAGSLEGSTRPVRVVVIDDHQMLADVLSEWLNAHPSIEVVGKTGDTDTALPLCLDLRPDVVLLDLNLPGRGTFDFADDLMQHLPQTRLVFLTGYLADVFVMQALRLRAAGYILKDEPASLVCNAVLRVMQGEQVYSSAVLQRLQFDTNTGRYVCRSQSELGMLTGRQLEVLRHLARGQSVKEIAQQMHLSQKSVDSHKYRIMNRLGIHDRVELTRFAIREGLALP